MRRIRHQSRNQTLQPLTLRYQSLHPKRYSYLERSPDIQSAATLPATNHDL